MTPFRPGWSRPILDEAERNLVAKGTPNAPRRMQRMSGEQFLEFLWKNRRQDMEEALADAAAMTRHPSRTLAERLAEIGRSCPKFAAQAASDLGLSIEALPPEAD